MPQENHYVAAKCNFANIQSRILLKAKVKKPNICVTILLHDRKYTDS